MKRSHTGKSRGSIRTQILRPLNVTLQRLFSGQEASGHRVTPSLPLGSVPTLGPFEGGYKWLLLACGPVWVGKQVALVTNGMSVLPLCYV